MHNCSSSKVQFIILCARYYYLCDAGYPNGEGFLTPYRGQRYHLSDWGTPPETPEEFLNMKHSSRRNVIEGHLDF